MSPRALWGSVEVGHVSCVTPSLVSATGGAELTTLASMARVTRSVSLLTGMSKWNSGPSFMMGQHSPHVAFHCSLTRLLVDARVVPESNLGGPLASPRWRFYGLGSRLGLNEKVKMTLSAFERVRQRPLGLICVFSPSFCSTRGGLGPFASRPLNLGLLI